MDFIKNFFYPNKTDILDPLSVIIKLFIYAYKPLGTKISIIKNKLIIQEVGIFQSTVRSINRDTKNDLINILFPLTFACELYLNELNYKKYKCIFEKILISFDNLNEIYQINEITHNIEQLKNILNSFLEDDNFDAKVIISNWDDPSSILKKSFYKQTNSVWTKERLEILFGHIYEILNSSTNNDSIELLIISLSCFMNYIDSLVIKMIDNLHLLR